MAGSVAAQTAPRHLSRLENLAPTAAKAELKKVETQWRVAIGRAVARCFALADLSQKEAAALLERDPGQVARWIAGTERAQVDAIFAVEQLRRPLVIALAELAECEVVTEIRVRRTL